MKHDVICIGAGGHAKVCIELLRSMGETVAFCIANETAVDDCLGVPILKGDEQLTLLRAKGYYRLFVAIGSNPLRMKLAEQALVCGYQLINAISPQAIVSPSAVIGEGVAIMAGVVINAATRIHSLAIINTGATVDHDCQIHQAVHIGPQSALAGDVCVGELSFLGVGCCVIPTITIGERVMIGAGAVVISPIPNDCLAVGVPAQIINSKKN